MSAMKRLARLVHTKTTTFCSLRAAATPSATTIHTQVAATVAAPQPVRYAHKGPPWQARHVASPQAGAEIPPGLDARRKSIIYRCKQRGWLEVDIILGDWAVATVPNLPEDQLNQIEHLLKADTPDVLAWILGHRDPPEEFDCDTLRSIRDHVRGDQPDNPTHRS